MSKLPKANKDLGQHFLKDQTVIKKICSDHTSVCDVIVEVGPGPGVLTKSLSEVDKPIFAIEKDLRFRETLEEFVPKDHLFLQDAMKFNWQDFIETHSLQDKKIWVVSNLPYNVGTVLFTQFLPVEQIQFMTLMFQKEVGQKTVMRDEKNQMNGLLILSQNYFQSKTLIKVAPGSFTPPPKVDSIVVSYTRKNHPDIDHFELLNSFTRKAFAGKRKQLKSVLKNHYSKEQIEKAFQETQTPPQIRAEALSYPQVLSLFQALHDR